MDCIFTDDEIEWMQSVTINSKREVITSEAVENPMASLLRAGVIQEKSGKLIVAAKYKHMFNVEQSPRKTKPEPEPEPKPVAKNQRIVGFGKIASKITVRENVGGDDFDDLVRCCAIHDGAYATIIENLCRGFETKDFSESVECGNVARAVFEQEIALNQSSNIAQIYLHITSRAQQLQVRLMRLAKRSAASLMRFV